MPITLDDVKYQITRLADTFGDKAYSEHRELAIWEAVKTLEPAQVIQIVNAFIRDFRHAPLPKDFWEAAKEFTPSQRRYALGEVRPQEICRCLDCGDSGFLKISRKPDFEPWAKMERGQAPCHCVRGRDLLEADARRAKNPIGFEQQFSSAWTTSYNIVPVYGFERSSL